MEQTIFSYFYWVSEMWKDILFSESFASLDGQNKSQPSDYADASTLEPNLINQKQDT